MLKFKAIEKESGLFVYGQYWRNGGYHYIRSFDEEKEDWVNYTIDFKTLCFSSGLFDKNNREIYTGDIVRFYNYFTTGYYEYAVISFENGAFVGKGKISSYDSEFTMYLYPYICKGEIIDTVHNKFIPKGKKRNFFN